ncbi:MAG: PAS domain S-box protein [Nitrospira sp.]|nr:PAS domain S-box protein [Nitrospira sp.]
MSPSQSFPGPHPSSIASFPQQTDTTRETSLSAQRIILLYQGLPAALIAGSGCALALVFVNWPVLPHSGLLAWLAYQLILATGRYGLARSFKAKTLTPAVVLRWGRAFVVGTAMAGLGWGAFAVFLFPDSSPTHQVFLAFVLGGIVAGASSTLAARFDAFLSFGLPTLIPLVSRFLTLGQEHALIMAVCAMLYSILLAYTALRMSNTIGEALRLKDNNARLVDQLAAQLQEGEQTELLRTVNSDHHRFIMEYAQDIIYRTDRSGRFTFINPAVIRLLGYHETEMLGHRALDSCIRTTAASQSISTCGNFCGTLPAPITSSR